MSTMVMGCGSGSGVAVGAGVAVAARAWVRSGCGGRVRSGCGGSSTVSMTWITPLDASMSVMTTRASFTITVFPPR